MRYLLLYTIGLYFPFLISGCQDEKPTAGDYPIRPVDFTHVKITDRFWKPKIDTNRMVTIPFGFEMSEETGRIDNFEIAGGLKQGQFCSTFPFDDSDVYKIIEGASYSLQQKYDQDLDQYLDSLILKISGAQQEDGYLQTWRIIDPENPGDDWWGEKDRWTGIIHGHELYNVGHLYEAAAAHYLATGKRSLLDVAVKNADLVNSVFGPGKKITVPGHEEIEIGLIKLYRITGKQAYLDLARFFVDERGVGTSRELFGTYHQDHKPVRQQKEAVGHAVRAGYLYSAMADLAAITDDVSYIPALQSIWEDIVFRKIYITGGIGARRSGESFGDPYELPNATAYAETCAAIANVLWNHRMFLLTGDGKYYDVLERSLFNGMLSGVSQSGDRFFYPNPLASDGVTVFNNGSVTRQPWFPCACCPSNISRIMPSIPSYVYGVKKDTVYVNLYMASEAEIVTDDKTVIIRQETEYPWEGDVSLQLLPDKNIEFTLALRIPGWAVNDPIPGDLYEFVEQGKNGINIRIDGQKIPAEIHKGYMYVKRSWSSENEIHIDLPLKIRKVKSHPNVVENKGKVALQRGPLVYCFEEADNGKGIGSIQLDQDSRLSEEMVENSLGHFIRINAETESSVYAAIPYFLWSNRGPGEMAVWIGYR